MTNSISILTKYAIIATIVKTIHEKGEHIGRTALQKLIFLLQTLYNVNCGYEFCFYTYGPFSSEILSNIEEMEKYNALKIDYINYQNGYSGYEIKPSSECEKVITIANDFLMANEEQLKSLLSSFGGENAVHLELYATIVWVDRDLTVKPHKSKEELANIVKELKPKFSSEEIQRGISFIEEKKFLLTA